MIKTSTMPAWTVALSNACANTRQADGGFSIDANTGHAVTGGYAVAAHPDREVILAECTMGDLLEFMIRNADLLSLPGVIMGGWHDPEDHRVYLDVSILVEDRDEAIKLAVDHDQLAIFDFATGESIKTY
jgi:hypothetical protein